MTGIVGRIWRPEYARGMRLVFSVHVPFKPYGCLGTRWVTSEPCFIIYSVDSIKLDGFCLDLSIAKQFLKLHLFVDPTLL